MSISFSVVLAESDLVLRRCAGQLRRWKHLDKCAPVDAKWLSSKRLLLAPLVPLVKPASSPSSSPRASPPPVVHEPEAEAGPEDGDGKQAKSHRESMSMRRRLTVQRQQALRASKEVRPAEETLESVVEEPVALSVLRADILHRSGLGRKPGGSIRPGDEASYSPVDKPAKKTWRKAGSKKGFGRTGSTVKDKPAGSEETPETQSSGDASGSKATASQKTGQGRELLLPRRTYQGLQGPDGILPVAQGAKQAVSADAPKRDAVAQSAKQALMKRMSTAHGPLDEGDSPKRSSTRPSSIKITRQGTNVSSEPGSPGSPGGVRASRLGSKQVGEGEAPKRRGRRRRDVAFQEEDEAPPAEEAVEVNVDAVVRRYSFTRKFELPSFAACEPSEKDAILAASAREVDMPVEIVERVRDVFHRHAKDTETFALTLPSFTACVLSLLGGQSKSDIPAHRLQKFWREASEKRDGELCVSLGKFMKWYHSNFYDAQNPGATPSEVFYIRQVRSLGRMNSGSHLAVSLQSQRRGSRERLGSNDHDYVY